MSAAGYDARIEADGCLTNLRIGGREFLAPGVSISRGSYFFLGGPLKLTKVERVSDNVVVASSDAASIRYEFGDNGNDLAADQQIGRCRWCCFIVFAKEVDAALDASGAAFAVPINQAWNDVALVAGDAKLRIRGCDKLWGPWEGPHQVCQVSLKPKEEKQHHALGRPRVRSERARIKTLAVPVVAEPKLQLYSPLPYQVFQRSSANQGNDSRQRPHDDRRRRDQVPRHGQVDRRSASRRVANGAIASGDAQFLGRAAAAGRRLVHARRPSDPRRRRAGRIEVEPFGVGEVFVGAGQSNSTNFGEIRTQPKSGMVSSFSGDGWQLADDPQPGVADKTQGGSFWPAFGDAMYERFGVPIGIASTGYGGTSVNQWQPGGDLFPWTMRRVQQLGPFGFRALLWHQGESDVEMPSDEYYAKLKNVIQSSRAQAGWHVPWFVAQASYHNPEQPRFETVRNAQARLWKDGVALPGPDTDTLTGDSRDLGGKGIHFSAKGLALHGQMWADRVGQYVEGILKPATPAGKTIVHGSPARA